jgi:rSAM/selenodomain-associated transferase 1
MSDRLLVFTRYPRPGAVKTRLVERLGAEGAAQLHRELTEHTLHRVEQGTTFGTFEAEVRFTGATPQEMEQWLGTHRRYVDQGDGDLGARLERAFADAYAQGSNRVVVIGTDCPDLSPGILARAFDLLIHTDLVVGPALDGGYYLLGIRHPAWDRARRLLSDMPWGTDAVLTETVRRAQATGLELARLDFLSDVDRPEDLIVWERIRDATTS